MSQRPIASTQKRAAPREFVKSVNADSRRDFASERRLSRHEAIQRTRRGRPGLVLKQWRLGVLLVANGVNRCRTYAYDGTRLYRFGHEKDDDDVFLRYEGSGPVPQEELKIEVVHSSRDFIWLENGVVLIPRNDFANQKQFIDELMRAGGKKGS